MENYFYLSDLGRTQLPSNGEISNFLEKENMYVLLNLDSSICLDIVNFVRHKKAARINKNKVLNLIEYVQKHDVEPTAIFALTELCYDRKTFAIQEEKFWDFKNKMDFVFKYPYKLLKKYEFDYEINYHVFKKQELQKKSIEAIIDQLNIYYAALLKIRELAKANLGREFAEKNILNFVEWMVDDLNIVLGPEFSLALQIFGGNSDFRSMLKLDSNKEIALKAIWGSAWDLFHVRASCNSRQLSEIVGRTVYPIFITNDSNLFTLSSPSVGFYAKLNSTKLVITENNVYPPHYTNLFMERLNIKMQEIAEDRIIKDAIIIPSKIKSIVEQLEKNLK